MGYAKLLYMILILDITGKARLQTNTQEQTNSIEYLLLLANAA